MGSGARRWGERRLALSLLSPSPEGAVPGRITEDGPCPNACCDRRLRLCGSWTRLRLTVPLVDISWAGTDSGNQ